MMNDLYEKMLEKHFHISYLKPYQELIISRILEDKDEGRHLDMLACLPTGAGKSLCFMLPAALSDDYMILIYPLLALMNDQAARFLKAGISAEMLRGNMGKEARDDAILRLRTKKSHVLITNIEMLLLMMKWHSIDFMRGRGLTIVLDEAHTVITWGETFRESYRETDSVLSYFRPDAVLAFTATMDSRIYRGLIREIFRGRMPYLVHASCDRQNIFYSVLTSASKKLDLLYLLKDRSLRPSVIFTRTRTESEELSSYLGHFIDCRHYHAGLAKEDKEEREDWFIGSHDGVMIATIAFGMGIDKPDIRSVIHAYLPDSAAAFLQEAGRGGRDGRISYSIVLRYEDEDSPLKEAFCGESCIRASLLRAMDESAGSERCLACSVCTGNPFRAKGTAELLRLVRRHPFKSMKGIIAVICRKNRKALFTHADASDAMKQMQRQGLITKRLVFRGLTAKGKQLLIVRGKR